MSSHVWYPPKAVVTRTAAHLGISRNKAKSLLIRTYYEAHPEQAPPGWGHTYPAKGRI